MANTQQSLRDIQTVAEHHAHQRSIDIRPRLMPMRGAPLHAIGVDSLDEGRIGYPESCLALSPDEQGSLALHEVVHLGQHDRLIEAQMHLANARGLIKAITRAQKGKSDEDPAALTRQANAFIDSATAIFNQCELEANRAEIEVYGFEVFYSAALKVVRSANPDLAGQDDVTVLALSIDRHREEITHQRGDIQIAAKNSAGADLSLQEIVVMLAHEQGVDIGL
ncbi:hypothetical protein GC177_01925 [bacterium]|nr:hypothetical protein [bacterium]